MHKEAGSDKFCEIASDYYRIVTTRRPSINLYERIIDDNKLDALNFIESLTSSRLREQRGETAFIPTEQKVFCENSSLIEAPFAYRAKSRFSNGSFGIFYAAKDLITAIEETKYHKSLFFISTNEKSCESQQRVLFGNLNGNFNDIRNLNLPHVYSPDDYTDSQAFGVKLRENNSDGVVYNSVRNKAGECFGVFKPNLIKSCREIKSLDYSWDGKKITVSEIK